MTTPTTIKAPHKVKAYAQADVCPLSPCGSRNTATCTKPTFVPPPNGGVMTDIEIVLECHDCGGTWVEVYSLKRIERIERSTLND